VKSALHTQQPTEVLCREKEISSINTFIDSRVNGGSAKSLYISGAPGTGKTAVIKHVLQRRSQVCVQIQCCFICANVMLSYMSHIIMGFGLSAL